MKKRLLTFLLLPLILTSCNGGGVSLTQMREKIANVSDELLYPYYKVVGSADFNNILYDVDAEFSNEPGVDTFVPYSRYNNGFYNATADISESDPNNIIIYSLASKSYWLRAPLRITKSNFYSEIYTISNSYINGGAVNVNAETGAIGSITLKDAQGKEVNFENAKITSVNGDVMNILADEVRGEEKTQTQLTFHREGAEDQDLMYAGKFVDDNHNVIEILKGTRENTTCAHYLIQHIITSYIGQTGSTNPSKNQMKMRINADGGFTFYGEAVHSIIYLDNIPYYPDVEEHPEVGEWDPEYPIPCYKNKINAKVNISLDYNADGWLVKESMQTIDYNYNVASVSQCSVVAVYGYRFQ